MKQLEMDFETGVWKPLDNSVTLHAGRIYVLRRFSGTEYAYALSDGRRIVVPLRDCYSHYLELPA